MTDPPYKSAVGRAGELGESIVPRLAIGARHADFDEFVIVQGATGFGHDALTEPTVADQHHGFERVGEAAQVTPLFVVKFHGAGL